MINDNKETKETEETVVLFGFELTFGQRYYSVGPLQTDIIEKWNYSGDIFDKKRIEMKNVFPTKKKAQEYLEYLQNFKG